MFRSRVCTLFECMYEIWIVGNKSHTSDFSLQNKSNSETNSFSTCWRQQTVICINIKHATSYIFKRVEMIQLCFVLRRNVWSPISVPSDSLTTAPHMCECILLFLRFLFCFKIRSLLFSLIYLTHFVRQINTEYCIHQQFCWQKVLPVVI